MGRALNAALSQNTDVLAAPYTHHGRSATRDVMASTSSQLGHFLCRPMGSRTSKGKSLAAFVAEENSNGKPEDDANDDDGEDEDEDVEQGKHNFDDETANQALVMAQGVVSNMNKVDAQIFASRTRLNEMTPGILGAEARRHVQAVAETVAKVPAHGERLDASLRKLYVDRDLLHKDNKWEPKAGQPFQERASLTRIADDAEDARVNLEIAVEPARLALRQMKMLRDEKGHPHMALEDVQKVAPLPAGELDGTRDPVLTAANCTCDPVSKCALRGQAFGWCHVHNDSKCDVSDGETKDPTGVSHELVRTSAEGKPEDTSVSHYWDYCVPPEAQGTEEEIHMGAIKTAHLNCRCAPRADILQKYDHDPMYEDEGGQFDPSKVPFSDRLTVEAMLGHNMSPNASLCAAMPDSGGYAVCPVAKECSTGLPGTGATGAGGAVPSVWFTGLGARTWDFCVPPIPKQEQPEGDYVPEQPEGDYVPPQQQQQAESLGSSATDGIGEQAPTGEQGLPNAVEQSCTSVLLPLLLLRQASSAYPTMGLRRELLGGFFPRVLASEVRDTRQAMCS